MTTPADQELEKLAIETGEKVVTECMGRWHTSEGWKLKVASLILSALKQVQPNSISQQAAAIRQKVGCKAGIMAEGAHLVDSIAVSPQEQQSEELGIAWGSWVKGEWDADEPECVRCYKAMSLNDCCEWSDFPELNLCDDCSRIVLEELRPNRVPPPASTPANPPKEGRASAEGEQIDIQCPECGESYKGSYGETECPKCKTVRYVSVPNIDTQREEEKGIYD